jgi:hypothetical protein
MNIVGLWKLKGWMDHWMDGRMEMLIDLNEKTF